MGVRSEDHLGILGGRKIVLSTRHTLQALKYDTSLMGHSFGPWEGLFPA